MTRSRFTKTRSGPETESSIVDDLIATGGTAKASKELVQQCGAEVAAFVFVINLLALEGTKKLAPTPVITILDY